MSEIGSFLLALFNHWAVLMSGIISLGITLYLRFRGRDISNKVFWAIGVVTLFIACFLTWRDEHVRKAPNLTCQIEKVIVGKGTDFNLTQVFAQLSVRDVGTPSIAEKYKLHIKASNFEGSIECTDIPNGYTLAPADKSQKLSFSQQDSLIQKTAAPIVLGGMERGWLRFVMQEKEATPDLIWRPGITYTVTLADNWGKPCSATYVVPSTMP